MCVEKLFANSQINTNFVTLRIFTWLRKEAFSLKLTDGKTRFIIHQADYFCPKSCPFALPIACIDEVKLWRFILRNLPTVHVVFVNHRSYTWMPLQSMPSVIDHFVLNASFDASKQHFVFKWYTAYLSISISPSLLIFFIYYSLLICRNSIKARVHVNHHFGKRLKHVETNFK